MRKNRFLALQKMAEQKKNEAMNATNAAMNDNGPPDHHGIPKQTVSLYKKAPPFHRFFLKARKSLNIFHFDANITKVSDSSEKDSFKAALMFNLRTSYFCSF